MAKEFNTSVTCDPERHYMVDTTAKMRVFERLINDKKYFTITFECSDCDSCDDKCFDEDEDVEPVCSTDEDAAEDSAPEENA